MSILREQWTGLAPECLPGPPTRTVTKLCPDCATEIKVWMTDPPTKEDREHFAKASCRTSFGRLCGPTSPTASGFTAQRQSPTIDYFDKVYFDKAMFDKAVNDLVKALEAGGYDAAPSTLVQGSA